jgi:regulatory protein YycH of two-component signal transduction system YycFG
MRWAKSYSIIDHQILHGGYLHRLSHEAMVLYLFLVTVGDRDGRSFYAEVNIMEILRLDDGRLEAARRELLHEGLIDYRRPYWRVNNLQRSKGNDRGHKSKGAVPAGCNETELLSDRGCDRAYAKERLKDISRILSGG